MRSTMSEAYEVLPESPDERTLTLPMPLAERNGATVFHCDWRSLLAVVPRCDLLVVDAPYSAKTHAGHDKGTNDANGVAVQRPDVRDNVARYKLGLHEPLRRPLSYPAWGAADVRSFVEAWHPRVDGWFVSITDDTLAPVWKEALEAVGRYAFAALPSVTSGATVRLSGDGPSSWTHWVIVARPATAEFAKWGTLPGAYVLPPGARVDMPIVGGKQPWLMTRIIEDYSQPGALVVDPCCGAGTSAIGAIRSGRRAIVGDRDLAHVELAAQWIAHPHRPPPGAAKATDDPQASLFAPTLR